MKTKQLRAKSSKELQKDLVDLREKLLNLQIDYRTKEIKNVREIRSIRRDIARILTITTEKAKGEEL